MCVRVCLCAALLPSETVLLGPPKGACAARERREPRSRCRCRRSYQSSVAVTSPQNGGAIVLLDQQRRCALCDTCLLRRARGRERKRARADEGDRLTDLLVSHCPSTPSLLAALFLPRLPASHTKTHRSTHIHIYRNCDQGRQHGESFRSLSLSSSSPLWRLLSSRSLRPNPPPKSARLARRRPRLFIVALPPWRRRTDAAPPVSAAASLSGPRWQSCCAFSRPPRPSRLQAPQSRPQMHARSPAARSPSASTAQQARLCGLRRPPTPRSPLPSRPTAAAASAAAPLCYETPASTAAAAALSLRAP